MSDHCDEIDAIVCAAVELASAEERADFIRGECGQDDALRIRIESLVDACLRAGDFLEAPAAAEPKTAWPPCESPGETIGRYRLLQQIGEGGFAVVFMAEQQQPVRRQVAVKVIKTGMDTRQVVARFEAERQALAMMDHPSIARIYDGGATEAGRPYFVMELVKGTPITEYCDQHRLNIKERLKLFGQVCDAVQHAHQKGVIHRDLKPNNVLVSTHDDRPLAKVIDFGIAKATETRLTDKTLFTDFRQLIGTPAYMSPEQADGSLDIDTRSDVYALGVLLYELLAGSPPFDPKELRSKAIAELQRVIREVEPPTPSTRFSTLAVEAQTAKASARQTDPKRLAVRIRGELDWIVMKALEKDRSRRYETANALADDIESYLRDEPVRACSPSPVYRLRKFMRRHRLPVALVSIAAAAVVALLIGSFVVRRERNEKAAALVRVSAEREKANEIAAYLGEILGATDPHNANEVNYTVRDLLDKSAEGLQQRFADQPEVEAEIRMTIGVAYRNLDLFAQAEPHLQRVVKLRKQTVGPNHELYANALVALAWNLAVTGRGDEATKMVETALSIYRGQSSSAEAQLAALRLYQWIDYERSDDVVRMAQELVAELPSGDNVDLASILHCHAENLVRTKQFVEGEELAIRALAMHRRLRPAGHSEIAWALWVLGLAQERQEKFVEAEGSFRDAMDIWIRLHGSRPEMRGQTRFSEGLIRVLKAQGRDDEAAEVAKKYKPAGDQ